MAVEGIDIDVKLLEDIADNINRLEECLKTEFEAIKVEIHSVRNIWKDPAGELYVNRAEEFDDSNGKFCHDLKAYALFLNMVAGEHRTVEKQIQQNAESYFK
ncbi:MAG: hypothetical protein NC347_14035 [Clostridium sp.]|nr:hypothetical protein [Clostridium sp.]